MSNGEFLRTAVDHTSAPHAMTRTYSGVSDLGRLHRLHFAVRSIPPKQVILRAARNETSLSC
jgi:hypothetical protein